MGYGYVGESQAAAAAQESFAGMAMAAMASSRVLSQGLNPSSSSNHPLGRVAVLGGRESLRDVIGSAYSADQRDLREGRGGGSFVAYVGGDSRLHSHGAGGGSVSSIGLVRRGEEKWAGLGLIHHDREQARTAAPIRTLDVGSLQERLIEVETGKNARENPHLGHSQQVQEEDSEGRLRSGQPGSSTCKECGNQAKKDCPHQRCRTCCKSRGFDCSTHIKSTWVPAAKRRERQAAEAAAAAAGQPRPTSKRNRALAMAALSGVDISAQPTSAGTSPRSSDPSQTVMSMKGSFPAEIRATALFKCVKVTGIDESENEYAYQTTVKIGGHIFKGVLSDHGLDPASSSSSGLPDLQLGGRSLPTNSALMDPSGMYGTSDSGLLGGN